MTNRLTIEMVVASNFWLNSFPPDSGISDVLSPRAIVTGSTIDFNRHCKLEFGSYVQTHEEHDNSMATRTVGALALRPTGNAQGGYYFFSLVTGRILNRNRWTEIPMPADVITRVHALARRNPRSCLFADRHQLPFVLNDDFVDEDDDSTYVPYDHFDDASAGVDDEAEDSDEDSDMDNNDEDDVNDNHEGDDVNYAEAPDIAIDIAVPPVAAIAPENVNYDKDSLVGLLRVLLSE